MNELHEPSPKAGAATDDGDALANLIRSAGKRPQPRPEDYERVLLASRATWRRQVLGRRVLLSLATAASIAVVAAAWLVWADRHSTVPIATVAAIQGRVEVEMSDGAWRDLRDAPGVSAGARVRTLADGAAAFTLANGASLRLDRATQVTIAAAARWVLDGGAVYVDSAGHGAATEIATAFGTVRDVGTQFEVRASSESLRIRVREGLVELASSAPVPRLRGTARDELTIDHAGNARRATIEPDSADWAWATSLAQLPNIDGQTALEIMRWIAHESGKELRFADSGAETRARGATLSGQAVDLTPLELLDVVVGAVDGLSYELAPGAIVIRSP